MNRVHPRIRVRAVAGAAAVAMIATGVLASTAAAAPAPPATPAAPVTEPVTVPGQVVVRWDDDATASERAAVRRAVGAELDVRFAASDVDVLDVPEHAQDRVIAALQRHGAVDVAEPEHVVQVATNDPGFGHLWGLNNTGQTGGTPNVDVNAPEAWATTKGQSSVVVAVIDTGVDISHPDLAGNIWVNADEIPGNGIDDDRNGYVDDVNGWDFVNNDRTVFDSPTEDVHGTHVAGTIAARADNGVGVAGTAPGVRIMPLKVLSGVDGTGGSSAAAAAIDYARANGATIVNASWGGTGGTLLQNAIKNSPGLVVVAASGNEGVNIDTAGAFFPAGWSNSAYGMGNIVSVTAVDHHGSRPSYANHGALSVDVGAPGHQIVSTVPGNLYGYLSGTSMAAPHVSGIAALARSVKSSLSGSQLASLVTSSTRPMASLSGVTTTGGMADAAAAVRAASGTTTTTPTPTTTTTTAPATSSGSTTPDVPAPYDGIGARTLDWACPGVLLSGFSDVPAGSTHAPGVGCAKVWGVVGGSSDGRFAPSSMLTRGQLASVLARAIERATGSTLTSSRNHYADDDTSVHAGAIDALADLGIVTGVAPGTYRPNAPVTRGQFATMLARTHRHLTDVMPSGPDAFDDDEGSVHEPAIDAMAAIGVLAGTGGGDYQPNAGLARAQAATLTARLLDALVEAGAATSPLG